MASSIASTSHSHQHHQQHVSRPTASNATRTASSSSSLGPGPAPDLTERFKLKAKYLDLQRDYFRALEIRKDLTIEVKEKQDKLQSLQDEVEQVIAFIFLLIDQIFDSDYARLEPSEDDLFSPTEDEDEDPGQIGKVNNLRTASSLDPSTSSAPPTGSHHGVIRKNPPRADSGDVDEAGPSAKRARVEEPGPHEEAAFPNGRRLEE
ncbi:BZ3500_MvSof-1268-A1-R1_Chr1-1g01055 [Microbotryum saponariae]|uniref:BZ3500_MvSof-1268-A1-R1_Chr1-1g01055 protein n=1 Tax=Microbotryum saponariae TaxID=289078 RepID=A0A2X0KEY5_9BASI|nr:BZ3500_MvSof-1268-A1-R1_Chr1-1g01055 [Microbotryum saponariae]SCZ93313.1 BZ3501_MvSof-1269-A2-R1_Chr1-1g00652 [Microbotryum saponariae]